MLADHDDLFTAWQVYKATRATLRCLQYWDETGLVSPSQKAKGTGTRRRYTRTDVMLISIVKRMRDQKVSLQQIRKHMPTIKRTVRHALEEGRIPQLRLQKKHPFILIPRGTGREQMVEIVDALSKGQLVFAIALDPIGAQVDQKLQRLVSRQGRPGVLRVRRSR